MGMTEGDTMITRTAASIVSNAVNQNEGIRIHQIGEFQPSETIAMLQTSSTIVIRTGSNMARAPPSTGSNNFASSSGESPGYVYMKRVVFVINIAIANPSRTPKIT